jgi:hypothetical protein
MNIVVCGGGTAGWLAAYIISKIQPDAHKITVVESSSIGIIGAGEGSTGLLYDVVIGHFWGENSSIDDFLMKTDSTIKMGIKHVNWTKEKDSFYFAPLDASNTIGTAPDILLNYVVSKYGNNKAYLSSHIGQSYERKRMPTGGHGFHFDAFKVGKYFKDKLMLTKKVECIDSTIKNVDIGTNGSIRSILLENNETVYGDFFIDCTGFSRVLMNKLEVPWKSYSKNLPANRAMPFIIDYDPYSKEVIEPLTTATALSSGWMWDIPLTTRKGCGYVYNSEFLSEEDAQLEVETYLNTKIKPIKHIKFDAGRLENLWIKNCLATGLAGAFNEPLEATSIHSTILQLIVFAKEYLDVNIERTCSNVNIKKYNELMTNTYDNYRDFLVLHYLGGRNDSDFWKYIKTGETLTPFVEETIEKCKYQVPTYIHYNNSTWGSSSHLWNWILCGLGYITPDNARDTLKLHGADSVAKSTYKQFSGYYDFKQEEIFSPFEIVPSNRIVVI